MKAAYVRSGNRTKKNENGTIKNGKKIIMHDHMGVFGSKKMRGTCSRVKLVYTNVCGIEVEPAQQDAWSSRLAIAAYRLRA